MMEFKTGDIFKTDAEALVNSVNCVGVMGRGIALQFKNMYPANFRAYAAACKREEVRPGRMFVYETGQLTNPRYIINFPTKRHWRSKSRIEDIESGIKALVQEVRTRDIRSMAMPPLATDLGGLKWEDVRPLIEAAMRELEDVRLIVFEPGSRPSDGRPNRSSDPPTMTAGRASLVGLMYRYLHGLLDPFVTLLEVHKLMYFLQVSGEPLKLGYTKAHYGPYAENLRHVIKDMEGHILSGYADGGDEPTKPLTLIPGAIQDAAEFLQSRPETLERFNSVATLVSGFESPFGLELLATVHWVATESPKPDLATVIRRTYDWNDHKYQFSERQIEIAYIRLKERGWLEETTIT